MKQQLSGAEILLRSLTDQGVDTLFGYPGGAILNVFDALYSYKDKLHHILVRHEQGAIHAAEGYARVSGKVGVCIVTSGPGATNTVTGIADAMLDSTPVVVIAGQVGTKMLGSDARASYGQTIIETSRSARSPLPSLSAGKKDLGRRIRSIAHEPKTTAVALAVLIPVLILTVGCTFTGKVSSTSEPQGKSMETAASADIAGETVPDHMTASGSENQGSIVEYKYTDGPESLVFGIAPYLKVNTSDHTFEFCPSVLSDYIAVGYYQQTSEQIILTANDESSHQYSFYINSAGDLVFDKNNSSIIPQYDYKGEIGTVCPVSDHAVFQKT